MERPAILHMLTPARNMSPFDINMALDAGFDHVATYGDVTLSDVAGLTQDAIYSRGPKGVARTGLFIGGRDIELADDMLRAARAAMNPPFVVSVFADPSGAFTTAAAAVAAADRAIAGSGGLRGKTFLILGGTGPVGAAAAVLGARLGARVQVGSHSSLGRALAAADMIARHYEAKVEAVCTTDEGRAALIAGAHVVLAAARAGAQVLSASDLAGAGQLLAVVDLNAVPPSGIEGLGPFDDRKPLPAGSGQAVGIGALAVGQVKYQTERRLFERMLEGQPLVADFREAFATAQAVCAAG